MMDKNGINASGLWTIATWNKADIQLSNKNLLKSLDKIWGERDGTNISPLKVELIGKRRVIWQRRANMIVQSGLNEIAKRSTGYSDTYDGFHAVGTGNTPVLATDTELDVQAAIKQVGAVSPLEGTARFGSIFYHADFNDVDTTITEAGLFTALLNGIMMARVLTLPQLVVADTLLTVQTNITFQNGVA